MSKRTLSDSERALWHLYTDDVKRTGKMDVAAPESNPEFKIKVPTQTVFKKTAASSVSNYESLKNNDSNWGKKLKAGKAAIEGKIDLHGMTCVEAYDKLSKFLERAQRNGKRAVLIVTGKGGPRNDYADYRFTDFENSRGVLRREVPLWLSGGAMRHMIVTFQDAAPRDGGSGALYVVLKRIK